MTTDNKTLVQAFEHMRDDTDVDYDFRDFIDAAICWTAVAVWAVMTWLS